MPRDTITAGPDVPVCDVPAGGKAFTAATAGRHFLFICGPFGPFTRRVGDSLRREGVGCSRVLLNSGDVLDWGLKHSFTYRGALIGFSGWLADTVRRNGVTDVITYGDAHPYCLAGLRVAADLGLKAHVLEQGYFRPFWITLEQNGVNGNSGLPRDPAVYRQAAARLPTPQDQWLPPLTPPAVWKLALYHWVLWLGTPLFPRFRVPYEYSIVRQAIGHIRRYLAQRVLRRWHRRRVAAAMGREGQRFLVILQRPGDSQLRFHSPFPTTADFIDRVIASFARHAPASSHLLFKAHPLDHGVENHARTIASAAQARGVAERVDFLDSGDLQGMLPGAAGAVTVNSTAGLSAIEQGVPTVVLGAAIYDMPGLTHQGGLSSFWTAAEAPDPDLYEAFRKVVVDRTQVSGAYAIREGVERAVPEVTRRLLAA